jgi:hypothetical protein
MTIEEGSDGETSEVTPDESSDTPSKDETKSRFDEFHERLDERESTRNRSEADRDDERANPDEATAEQRGEIDSGVESESESESETDGWVWGLPGKFPEMEESERLQTADLGEQRIWNDEIGDRSGASEIPSETDTGNSDNEIPTQSPDPSAKIDSSNEISERDGSSESKAENRWAEIGADLRTDESADDVPRRRTETERSAGEIRMNESLRETREETENAPSESSGLDQGTTDETAVSRRDPANITSVTGGNRPADLERATSAGSVLVLGPTSRSISDAICSKFLVGERGSRNALFVTFDDSPTDRLDVCHRSDEWTGGEIGIIEVGRGGRNSPAVSETTGDGTAGSITVRHVSNPGDLSKLGIVISQLLADFDETPRQTVLCFHTLSALHSQIGTKTLFRFLNTLQGRLRSADAIGHYHMDPELHDDLVIETLRPIFDVIVRFSADGTLEVE